MDGGIPEISIKIIGVGGGGSNTLNMILPHVANVSFAAINTDAKALELSRASEKILIGRSLTRGASAGGDTKIGKAATLADLDAIKSCVGGVDLLFICTCLGGGTGSAAAPIIAQTARDAGTKVIAFCTTPFELEGKQRQLIADTAFENMRKSCDAAIALPNELMLGDSQNINEALRDANRSVVAAISMICEMLQRTGLMNIDFGNLKRLLGGNLKNSTLFAYAKAQGEKFAQHAVEEIVKCPMLQAKNVPQKAKRLLVSIRCGEDLPMNALKAVLINVASRFSDGNELAFGAIIEENFAGKIEICAIGVEEIPEEKPEPPAPTQLELPPEIISPKPPKTRQKTRARTAKERKLFDENQGNFDIQLNEQRGLFATSQPNIRNNEDLDIPTYLRKNIKLAVKK